MPPLGSRHDAGADLLIAYPKRETAPRRKALTTSEFGREVEAGSGFECESLSTDMYMHVPPSCTYYQEGRMGPFEPQLQWSSFSDLL